MLGQAQGKLTLLCAVSILWGHGHYCGDNKERLNFISLMKTKLAVLS